MKNIFIIHSLNGDTLKFWGKQIKNEFGKRYDIFMPQFPIRAESSYDKFENILSQYLINKELNEQSIVVCHSIGNPYFIRFCREHTFVPYSYIAVAPGAVYDFPSTRTDYIVEVKKQAYLQKIDFEYAKNFNKFYLLYSDEDDGNKEKFTKFINDMNPIPIYLKGYNHFDGYHRIYMIPELVDLIKTILN